MKPKKPSDELPKDLMTTTVSDLLSQSKSSKQELLDTLASLEFEDKPSIVLASCGDRNIFFASNLTTMDITNTVQAVLAIALSNSFEKFSKKPLDEDGALKVMGCIVDSLKSAHAALGEKLSQ